MSAASDDSPTGVMPVGRVLDTRPAARFETGHSADAANIPLEELEARVHELPPRDVDFELFDEDSRRAEAALRMLQERAYTAVRVLPPDRATEARDSEWITGTARVRLWRPHELVVRAATCVQRAEAEPGGACVRPTALDLACGSGRDAVYLAMCGFDVTALDHLPDAIERARDLARRCGVAASVDDERHGALDARCVDVLRDESWCAMRCDLVMVFNFLDRRLINSLRECVRPRGLIAYETFVAPQRERYGKPRREAFELARDELRGWFADWDVVHYDEGERQPGRITAQLLARRPA